MVKLIVTGAAGRMGRHLICAALESPEAKLVGATEAPGHPALGQDAGRVAGQPDTGVILVKDLREIISRADAVIDFSSPRASMEHIEIAAAAGKAMVIGTTGLTGEQKEKIKNLSSSIPCVLSPNMSQGVNLMFKLAEKAASVLGEEFDIEVLEAHHRMKKDAPSGTAMQLGEILARARGRALGDVGRFHRQGIIGERPRGEIGMQTVRAGDIVGEHTVLLAGPGERIEITHRAHSRDTFARGAVRAALWIVKQNPGLYNMLDVLSLSD